MALYRCDEQGEHLQHELNAMCDRQRDPTDTIARHMDAA